MRSSAPSRPGPASAPTKSGLPCPRAWPSLTSSITSMRRPGQGAGGAPPGAAAGGVRGSAGAARRWSSFRWGRRATLAELIDRWRASYGAGKAPPAGATDPGRSCGRGCGSRWPSTCDDVKVVLVSPTARCTGSPWAALPGSKEGTFLIHEYAFAVVPVPQLLPELLRASPAPGGRAAVACSLAGGIAFGEEKARDAAARDDKLPPVPVFGPLAGTESEVNDLRAQFEDVFPDAPRSDWCCKDKATKQAVLAALPSHRFAHLATHGFFADRVGDVRRRRWRNGPSCCWAGCVWTPRPWDDTRGCSPGWSSPGSTCRTGSPKRRS